MRSSTVDRKNNQLCWAKSASESSGVARFSVQKLDDMALLLLCNVNIRYLAL